jgi:hypothetical protein
MMPVFLLLLRSHSLTKVATSIGVSGKSELCDALRKDEEYIFSALRRILDLEMCKQTGCLQGHDGQRFLSLIQMV